MSSSISDGLTELLRRARQGDSAAASEAFARVYEELHGMAERLFSRESPGHTLQPTVIVHEIWLKMRGPDGGLKLPMLESRAQFFIIAANAMRQILVDHARGKRAAKRGGGQVMLTIAEWDGLAIRSDVDLVDLDDAVQRLAAIRPRAAQVVVLKFFGGCTIPQIAAALTFSLETIKGDWRLAKAWLKKELPDHA